MQVETTADDTVAEIIMTAVDRLQDPNLVEKTVGKVSASPSQGDISVTA